MYNDVPDSESDAVGGGAETQTDGDEPPVPDAAPLILSHVAFVFFHFCNLRFGVGLRFIFVLSAS